MRYLPRFVFAKTNVDFGAELVGVVRKISQTIEVVATEGRVVHARPSHQDDFAPVFVQKRLVVRICRLYRLHLHIASESLFIREHIGQTERRDFHRDHLIVSFEFRLAKK